MKVTSHYSELEARDFDGDTVKGVTGRIAIGSRDGAPQFLHAAVHHQARRLYPAPFPRMGA